MASLASPWWFSSSSKKASLSLDGRRETAGSRAFLAFLNSLLSSVMYLAADYSKLLGRPTAGPVPPNRSDGPRD